jgi:hypothetical protein
MSSGIQGCTVMAAAIAYHKQKCLLLSYGSGTAAMLRDAFIATQPLLHGHLSLSPKTAMTALHDDVFSHVAAAASSLLSSQFQQ